MKEKNRLSAILIIFLTAFFFTSIQGSFGADSQDMKKEGKISETKKKSAPEIKFYNKSHDFGTVLQGSTVKHSFAFKNAGNETLIINKVQAG